MRKFLLAASAVTMMVSAPAMALEVGQPAPEIAVKDYQGNDFKLSDHKGKIVVLEWTNSQCPYVIKHYDSGNMQKLQKEATAMDDVEWITVNSSATGKQGAVTAEEEAKILADTGAAPTTVLLDPSGEIGKAYDAKTTPHMFVVDAEGMVAYAGAIDDNSSPRQSVIPESKNYVMAAVNSLKAGEAVEVTSTQPYGCAVKY